MRVQENGNIFKNMNVAVMLPLCHFVVQMKGHNMLEWLFQLELNG
jgi:hypothetical protein